MTKNFTNSYEKFKANFEGSALSELLNRKSGAIEANLKKFGITLLCKLLLLVKYVNELVGNEFKSDLQEFLKSTMLEGGGKEVLA